MKYTTINLGDNKIEIFNSILGKETIKVNDEIISSKYSIFGAKHYFSIIENGIEVDCEINIGLSIHGIIYDLYIDNKPIIVANKNGCVMFFAIIGFLFIILPILEIIL